MRDLLREEAPQLSEDAINIMHSIAKNCTASANGKRWDRSAIHFALGIWTISPKAYSTISEKFTLPSVRLLQQYKNIVHQVPGFNPQVFQWLTYTADRKNLPSSGRRGGLVFDEMAIQEDLQMDNSGGNMKLVGAVDLGTESRLLDKLRKSESTQKLSSHVLQFEFLGHNGFSFPIAHFPTRSIQAYDLIPIFWQCVRKLLEYDFHVDFCLFDGAVSNRNFLKALCYPSDPLSLNMTIPNIEELGGSITLGMDIKHVVKRLRNNVYSSGYDKSHTRLLQWHGKEIIWDQWKEAFQWDTNINPEMMRLHHKLTQEHMELNSAAKMRNHLAEDTLDENMLNLMRQYASTMEDSSHLEGAISFLQSTSQLVAFSKDDRHITSLGDVRIDTLTNVATFFSQWEASEKGRIEEHGRKGKKSALMSTETMEDIQFTCFSLTHIIKKRLSNGDTVLPSRINSDVVENFFCQQRTSRHGACTNPTYLQYSKGVNTIILSSRSKKAAVKSNPGINGATPYNYDCPQPLVKKRRS